MDAHHGKPTLQILEESIEDYAESEYEAFLKSELYRRVDRLVDEFGNKLLMLTIDGAVEEIVQLKNADIASAKANPYKVEQLEQRIAALDRQILSMRHQLYYARSFRYLLTTTIERVLEKLRIRKAQDPVL